MKSLESQHIIRINTLEVSRENCTITAGDQEIKVSPRSMDVLVYLAEHQGRVVSPEELLDQFWSALASDHAVHKAIAELRAAMGDSVRLQRYIKTVPKRGYKLLTPASMTERADKVESRAASVAVEADPAEGARREEDSESRFRAPRLPLARWRQIALAGICSVGLVGLGMLVEAKREAVASVVVVESAPLCSINSGQEGYLLLVSLVQTGSDSVRYPLGLGLRRSDLRDGSNIEACADREMVQTALAPLMDAAAVRL